MQSLKRDLAIGFSASAVIFACALAWGSPFVATSSVTKPAQVQAQTQSDQAQPEQDLTGPRGLPGK